MKNAFIITALLILLIVTTWCNDVKSQPTTLYISTQPVDVGFGVRMDYNMYPLSFYNSVSYGNMGLYRLSNLKHHIKISTGINMPLEQYHDYIYHMTAGINYHIIQGTDDEYNYKMFNPWSFELGLSVKFSRFAIAVRTDILRWEPCVDVGIPLKYKHYD